MLACCKSRNMRASLAMLCWCIMSVFVSAAVHELGQSYHAHAGFILLVRSIVGFALCSSALGWPICRRSSWLRNACTRSSIWGGCARGTSGRFAPLSGDDAGTDAANEDPGADAAGSGSGDGHGDGVNDGGLDGNATTSWVSDIFGERRNRPLLFARGLLAVGGVYSAFVALARLPVGDASVIMAMNPLITSILAAAILRERLSYVTLALLVISLGAVILLAYPASIFGHGNTTLSLDLPIYNANDPDGDIPNSSSSSSSSSNGGADNGDDGATSSTDASANATLSGLLSPPLHKTTRGSRSGEGPTLDVGGLVAAFCALLAISATQTMTRALKGEGAMVVTLYLFGAASFVVPVVLALSPKHLGYAGIQYSSTIISREGAEAKVAMVMFFVGANSFVQQWIKTWALQQAPSVSVIAIDYFRIPLMVIYQMAVDHEDATWHSLVGTGILTIALVAYVVWMHRTAARAEKEKQDKEKSDEEQGLELGKDGDDISNGAVELSDSIRV